MANREAAQKKIDDVVSELNMSKDERQAFHRFLAKYYGDEKDDYDYNELRERAKEFLRDYRR